MRDQEANETFGLLLDQCSLECNDVEPASHLHVLTAKVTKAAETAFANDRAKPRQPWMSPITYAIVVEAKQVSKRLRRTGRWIARSAQKFAFMFWATVAGHKSDHLCQCTVVWGFVHPGVALLRAKTTGELERLSDKFRSYAELEKLVWLEACADKTLEGLTSLHQKAIHDAVKPFKPRTSQRTARRLETSPGVDAGSFVEERYAFRNRWSKLLGGKTSTFADLVSKDRERWCDGADGDQLALLDSAALPTRTELVRRFAASKRKAAPEDGLGGELFAAQPQRMARLFHPLLTKSFTSLMLPMQIRGGQIHEIYKGKGSQKQATSYRDVTIASEFAKTVGSLLRPRMLSTVAAVSGGTQFGSGLNTGSTDVAHVLVRAYIDVAQVLHVSLGLLFVDLSSAFASVARACISNTRPQQS